MRDSKYGTEHNARLNRGRYAIYVKGKQFYITTTTGKLTINSVVHAVGGRTFKVLSKIMEDSS